MDYIIYYLYNYINNLEIIIRFKISIYYNLKTFIFIGKYIDITNKSNLIKRLRINKRVY